MKALLALLLTLSAVAAAETNQPPNRPALTIRAEYSVFDLRSNVFLYTNHVIVIDPPSKPGDSPTILTCHWAVAKSGVNRRLETVFAHEAVAIDQGDNHARGALAVYTATNELMTLTGAFHPEDTNFALPVLYSSQGTNYGTRIIYDRINDKLFIDNPQTIIPHSSLANADRGKTNSAATNRPPRSGSLFPGTK